MKKMQTLIVKLTQHGGDSTGIRTHGSTPESVFIATSCASFSSLLVLNFTFRQCPPKTDFVFH